MMSRLLFSFLLAMAIACIKATESPESCPSNQCAEDVDIEVFEESEAEGLQTTLLQVSMQLDVKHEKMLKKEASLPAAAQATSPSSDFAFDIEAYAAEMAQTNRLRIQDESMEAQERAKAELAGGVSVNETQGDSDVQDEPPAKAVSTPFVSSNDVFNATTVKESKVLAHHHHHHSDNNKLIGEIAIPFGAFAAGALCIFMEQRTAGLLAIYFGAQAGFGLYMKVVLSDAKVSEDLKGVPAGFLVTAVQQFVAFVALAVGLAFYYMVAEKPYIPRRLTSFREVAVVLLFSGAFAINIGLNNFSLSLMAVSLNLIIRSCLPLVTLILQQTIGMCLPSFLKDVQILEVTLMVAGVAFAALATLAKSESAVASSESAHLVLGVVMCSLSDVAAATNLILAGMFGETMKPPLNPLDTILYMSLPCALFLVPASILAAHPVDWQGYNPLTDVQVFEKVVQLSPMTLLYVLLSGFFAAGYNILQYTVVQQLSASHAAFAGNFNKAATIMLSIFLGLEQLPGGVWSTVMLLAILGNIGAFTGYSMLKTGDKAHAPAVPATEPVKQ
jgi:drug/metabolite transporter (DMT)-like permease